MPPSATLSTLLRDSRDGDRQATVHLTPILYEELRNLARRALQGERTGHTLQATDLAHEAFTRLAGIRVPAQDRVHFLALAATTMRRVLTDHARSRRTDKRGGGRQRQSLESALSLLIDGVEVDYLKVDLELEGLARIAPRAARVVVLRVFGGMTHEEVAAHLGISQRVARAEFLAGRGYLRKHLAT